MRLWVVLSLILTLFGGSAVAQGQPLQQDSILSMALQSNPGLEMMRARIARAQGERLQASLMPNPTAMVEIENFAGTGSLQGFDGAEITIGMEQEIEVSGKRGFRTDVATHSLSINQQEIIAQAMGVLANADAAFMRVVITQERLAIAENRLSLANKTHETVKSRVQAAAASDIQHTKVDIEQSSARLQKSRADMELSEARGQLATLIGSPDNVEVQYSLNVLPALQDRQKLLESLDNTPQMRAREFASRRAASEFDLARAQAVPNPTLGIGVRRFNEDADTALVAGLTIPLPVFNRNQGAIESARAGMRESAAMARQQNLVLRQQAVSAWENLAAAHNEVEAYQKSIIPSAQRAYDQALDGYSAGRFSLLDLLDAQRTLYEVKDAWLDSLLAFHEARTQTDFLMGIHGPLIQKTLGDMK